MHRTDGHAGRNRAAAELRCTDHRRCPPHHGYLFANARATRIKLLVHDGFGVWCAARRLNAGHFAWPREAAATPLSLTQVQFDALVVGLPWQRLPEMSVVTRM